MELKLINKF